MGFEPMRLAPREPNSRSLTSLGHPRYEDLQIIVAGVSISPQVCI